jgi:transposase InsO family protein
MHAIAENPAAISGRCGLCRNGHRGFARHSISSTCQRQVIPSINAKLKRQVEGLDPVWRRRRCELTMAWFRRKPGSGAMHHSDRGAQYASHAFQEKLTEYVMTCSMSRKGNCWVNAPTESFFNSLKNERVHERRYATHADAIADLFESVAVFYNRSRCHSTLCQVLPTQFMQDWITTQQEKNLAA